MQIDHRTTSVAFKRTKFICISMDKNHLHFFPLFYNLQTCIIAQRQWEVEITLMGKLDRTSTIFFSSSYLSLSVFSDMSNYYK